MRFFSIKISISQLLCLSDIGYEAVFFCVKIFIACYKKLRCCPAVFLVRLFTYNYVLYKCFEQPFLKAFWLFMFAFIYKFIGYVAMCQHLSNRHFTPVWLARRG